MVMIITKQRFIDDPVYFLDMLKDTEAKDIIIADDDDLKVSYRLSVIKEDVSTEDETDSIDDGELYNKILKTFGEEKTKEIYDQVDILYKSMRK